MAWYKGIYRYPLLAPQVIIRDRWFGVTPPPAGSCHSLTHSLPLSEHAKVSQCPVALCSVALYLQKSTYSEDILFTSLLCSRLSWRRGSFVFWLQHWNGTRTSKCLWVHAENHRRVHLACLVRKVQTYKKNLNCPKTFFQLQNESMNKNSSSRNVL